ncbi:MAG: response regulator [Chloroflexota bacterium]
MTQTILAVDDTPDNLRLLSNILTEQGYKVRLAPSGAHAITTIQKELPDLILLDIMMPEMDGYEVCHYLKGDERTKDIPVIFLSALNEVMDKMRAFSVGGLDYVEKPFQVEEVLARVKTHLTLHSLQQTLEQQNQILEEKVEARTEALAAANEALKEEIEQRIAHQEEKDRLFNVVSQQSEQLRKLTTWLIDNQQSERQGLASGLQQEIEQNIALLKSNLELVEASLTANPDPIITDQISNANQVLAKMSQYVQNVTTNLSETTAQEKSLSENPLIKLTAREREVLRLMAEGKNNADIAAMLTIATTTIHTYTSRIKQKLDIHNLSSLIKFAIEHKLLE